MRAKLREFEVKFWSWMRGSGTIAWARLCIVFNVILIALAGTDISGLNFFATHPQWLIFWNIINGIITEVVRRHGTEIQTSSVYVEGVPISSSKLVPIDDGSSIKAG